MSLHTIYHAQKATNRLPTTMDPPLFEALVQDELAFKWKGKGKGKGKGTSKDQSQEVAGQDFACPESDSVRQNVSDPSAEREMGGSLVLLSGKSVDQVGSATAVSDSQKLAPRMDAKNGQTLPSPVQEAEEVIGGMCKSVGSSSQRGLHFGPGLSNHVRWPFDGVRNQRDPYNW
jgi:hypothetical protein